MCADEVPFIDKKKQLQLYREHKPLPPPKTGSDEHNQLSAFCEEVEIILQTVSDNEYQAATTLMDPPNEKFKRAVVFPSAGKVVGLFAGHQVALIQTDEGSNSSNFLQKAIDTFPNARFIIAVGVCYALDSTKYKTADVLVSKKISDLKNLKFSVNDDIIDRGQSVDVVDELKSIFCMDLTFDEDFVVSKTRVSGE